MGCSKTFEDVNDWKRHETSEHFHLEMWRCDGELPAADECAYVGYYWKTFEEHLRQVYQLDDDAVDVKAEMCRIGRNGQGRFWCGFCRKLIDLRTKGLGAWKERFDFSSF
jgi:hypothetical protein